MRPVLSAVAAALAVGLLAGCALQQPTAHPNPIIVREFSYSLGAVTLDPSFGFSLYRGSAGVPPRQRAGSVARGAAFSLADAVAQQLSLLGYDVIRDDTTQPEPGARAIVVTGSFRHIDEGRRRHVGAENPSIAVDAAIDYQAAGAAPQRITELQLDSNRIARDAIVPTSGRRGVDVNAAASRVGGALARFVSDTARLNNWPSTPR